MVSNKLAFVAVAAGCLVTAGIGGYFAVRQNVAAPAQVVASTPAAQESAQAPAAPAATPAAALSSAPAAAAPAATSVGARQAPAAEAKPAPKPAMARNMPAPASQVARHEELRPAAAPSTSQALSSQPSPAPLAQPPAPAPVPAPEPPPAPRPEERIVEALRAPEPVERELQEVTVGADSVMGLQIENSLSSERSRVEDRVEARVTRDVRAAGRIAIPAGSRVIGSVVVVERGGKFKERARLGIRFNMLVLNDNTRLPISTDTIYREGDQPSSAGKIGSGAVAGAILGAIAGGAKGAAIGASAGAGAGAAAVGAGERSQATFYAGTSITARLLAPVTITLER